MPEAWPKCFGGVYADLSTNSHSLRARTLLVLEALRRPHRDEWMRGLGDDEVLSDGFRNDLLWKVAMLRKHEHA